MNLNDLKIGVLNVFTFIVSFTNVETFLKITLLVVSIVLTILKIIEHFKKREADS